MSQHKDRSYENLTNDDLEQLSFRIRIKLGEKLKPMKDLICIGLIQNAAVHYIAFQTNNISNSNGIHDFDTICFFKNLKSETRQRPIKAESGLDKFGKCSECKGDKKTRKIDIFCKKLNLIDNDIEATVSSYFTNVNQKWGKTISERSFITIYPKELIGKELWKGKS